VIKKENRGQAAIQGPCWKQGIVNGGITWNRTNTLNWMNNHICGFDEMFTIKQYSF
jgi:hypothetical protein